jgi:hypothetical protein
VVTLMTHSHSMELLAASSAALVEEYDLTGMLIRALGEATGFVDADAGGLLVTSRGRLELLAATSHGVAELETYQAMSGEGPCVECLELGAAVGYSLSDVAARWPPIADLMEAVGFGHVVATPLRWRGAVLGGLNLFWASAPVDPDEAQRGAQIYSDILTLGLVNSRPMGPDTARERVEAALEGRALIEQAKGVLAELEAIDMADAYERLLEHASQQGLPLTRAALETIAAAQHNDRVHRDLP